MRRWLGSLFAPTRRDDHLSRYVLREYAHGRSLGDVLDDPYVRNRSTAEQRARLLERPEVVEAIGRQAIDDLHRGLERRGSLAGAHA